MGETHEERYTPEEGGRADPADRAGKPGGFPVHAAGERQKIGQRRQPSGDGRPAACQLYARPACPGFRAMAGAIQDAG